MVEALGALVVGAGPAGLAAAEALCAAGLKPVIAEAMPSAGRKFLMAGKSGLNLTKDAPRAAFGAAYAEAEPWLAEALETCGPAEVSAWAEGLGQEVFTGSSGRMFPKAMKASPLLRAWLRRLSAQGAELRTRWRWRGLEGGVCAFDTPEGARRARARATVLAMGGASWARLGSDGAWAGVLEAAGVETAPFRPANMGFEVDWSAHMAAWFGAPVKAAALIVGDRRVRGEFMISARGLEGSAIYAVSRALREGEALRLDLAPDLDVAAAARRLGGTKASVGTRLRRLGLDGARRALAMEFGRPLPGEAGALAAAVKGLAVPLKGPRPMDEAISTAGGVRREAVDEGFMLRAAPGVFCAGEMLDWEAPTGGYLITGCLATGRAAGRAAAAWARAS
ncbi:MAG: TIGR03862 family flavoprotein, partial [Pseudomonadota bacterium]